MIVSWRIGGAVASLLSVVCLSGLVAQALGLRDAFQQQQDVRTRDAAASLSAALLPLVDAPPAHVVDAGAAPAAPEAVPGVGSASPVGSVADAIDRRFAQGPYRRLALSGVEGVPAIDLRRSPADEPPGGWFASVLSITETTVREPIGRSGELLLEIDAGWARRAAWQAWSRAAVWQVALAVPAVMLSLWVLRPRQRRTGRSSLDDDDGTTAYSIYRGDVGSTGQDGDGLRDPLALPGEDGLADAMAVGQLRLALQVQAAHVATLEQRALTDSLTGCALRQHFIGQLQQRLAEPGGPGAALLLVRILKLQALNLHHGRTSTDRLLQAVADVLLTYVDRVPGAFAGRLNGADFALCLPVPGVARETVTSMRAALTAAPALRGGIARVVVGGVDGIHDTTASQALTAADEALARAESAPDGTEDVVVDVNEVPSIGTAGGQAWREQIASALAEGRFSLADLGVVSADGSLLHLECPLRVQLLAGGAFESAERWLALARRSRLLPEVDLAAARAALRAIARDGVARAVHVSPVSLASTAYRAGMQALLSSMPATARLLKLECLSGPHAERTTAALATAAAAWRPLGVHIGVVHAGGTPQDLAALQSIGVDYVKVDARHLRGAATDAAMQGYARSLAALVHGLGMTVLAGGIDDAADVEVLWAVGFDGATGPAVTPAHLADSRSAPGADPATVTRPASPLGVRSAASRRPHPERSLTTPA